MKAAVVAVGTELLGVDRLDTNSLFLARVLETYGVELRRKVVLGDTVDDIAQELGRLAGEVDLVIVSGGLGPTADDVTREATAQAFGRGLTPDADALADLEARFRRFGVPMPAPNRKQADRIDGATLLANPLGTAPGQRVSAGDCTFFLLPGRAARARGADRDRDRAVAARALGRRRHRAPRAQGRLRAGVGSGGAHHTGLRRVRPRVDHGAGQAVGDPGLRGRRRVARGAARATRSHAVEAAAS